MHSRLLPFLSAALELPVSCADSCLTTAPRERDKAAAHAETHGALAGDATAATADRRA